MKFRFAVLLLSAVFAVGSALAQSPAKLKAELQAMEKAAKKDPDELFKAAQFATEKGMAADAKRLTAAVLKLKADHEGANLASGNELVDGKWLAAKDAAAARKKLMAAEYSAKGYVEVSGVWVQKEEAADAKRGIFHHENELVTKGEKLALMAGQVRHPATGELIPAAFAEKAQNRYFPLGGNRWVDESEANKFHSDLNHPWILRSSYCTIYTTLDTSKHEELKREADRGYECMQQAFQGAQPTPANRPVAMAAGTEEEYRTLGTQLGDGTDAAGACLIREEAMLNVPLQGEVRAGLADYRKDLGPYYLRHAIALAYANGLAADAGVDLPAWFLQGFGSLARYFMNDSDAGWFSKPLLQRGGARNLKGFFAGFAISGDLESSEISAVLFESGLMHAYAMRGGDAKATELFTAAVEVVAGKKKGGLEKPLKALEEQLIQAEPAIAAYLQQLAAKAPK